MKDYTKYFDNYPIPKENFIKSYVLVKNKYIVRLADGQKISIPETAKQKRILDEKLLIQINSVSEKEIAKIKNRLNNKLNIHRVSLSVLISFIIILFLNNFAIYLFPSVFLSISISAYTYFSYIKNKYVY